MAINLYGSCSGSSGSKYDIWLKARQNSQSVEDNSSNITLTLYLKRNDGYSASAYNLNEGDNSAKITVNGAEMVSKSLAIDTRNSATVTLAKWTGDVSHNADGTLTLAVGGSFTMGGTSLSGGSVKGELTCTSIPRASSMSLSAASLNPGGSVTAQITSASESFNHKIVLSLGGSAKNINAAQGEQSVEITVPLLWAEEITNAKSGKISVELITYSNGKKIGSKMYSLKLVIPATSDFKPDFTLVVERIDNAVPENFGEYVKGISQIRVSASEVTLKYGALQASCTATVGALSEATLPATFDLNTAGDITVSVTLKDSRGFSVKKTQTVTVADYSAPAITVNSLSRCDEEGNVTVNGTSLIADLSFLYSSVNSKNTPVVTFKYRKMNSEGFSGEEVITEPCSILGGGVFDINSSYVVAFKITDCLTTEGEFFEYTVSSAHIPFNIRKGGKGAAFGCYAENDNELKVAWDLNLEGKILCEDVEITPASNISASSIVAKYFPCLNMVMLRMRLNAGETLAPGENHVVATVKNRLSSIFTPFCVRLNNTGASVQASGGLMYETGEVIVSADTAIEADRKIYISGIYFPDYEQTQ